MDRDHLIDAVEHRRHQEYLAHVLPSVAKKVPSMFRILHEGPEIGRPSLARVLHAGADREERGHRRLEDEAKRQRPVRPVDQLVPESLYEIAHGVPCQRLRLRLLLTRVERQSPAYFEGAQGGLWTGQRRDTEESDTDLGRLVGGRNQS
jgi:hypothetical protein